MQGCFQVGKALCIPPIAVLGGLLTVTSYIVSPAIVEVPGTEWAETALIWLSINMPTGIIINRKGRDCTFCLQFIHR